MRLLPRISAASLVSIFLVIGALWAWESAADFASDLQTDRPAVVIWATRSAAIAAVALSQWTVLYFVIGSIYPRRFHDSLLRVFFGVASALAGAIALGLAVVG